MFQRRAGIIIIHVVDRILVFVTEALVLVAGHRVLCLRFKVRRLGDGFTGVEVECGVEF